MAGTEIDKLIREGQDPAAKLGIPEMLGIVLAVAFIFIIDSDAHNIGMFMLLLIGALGFNVQRRHRRYARVVAELEVRIAELEQQAKQQQQEQQP